MTGIPLPGDSALVVQHISSLARFRQSLVGAKPCRATRPRRWASMLREHQWRDGRDSQLCAAEHNVAPRPSQNRALPPRARNGGAQPVIASRVGRWQTCNKVAKSARAHGAGVPVFFSFHATTLAFRPARPVPAVRAVGGGRPCAWTFAGQPAGRLMRGARRSRALRTRARRLSEMPGVSSTRGGCPHRCLPASSRVFTSLAFSPGRQLPRRADGHPCRPQPRATSADRNVPLVRRCRA